MNEFTPDDLKTLLTQQSGWCVSILQPTHRAGHQVQEDPIRFKNLLRQAGRRLTAARVRKPDAEALLGPLSELLNDSLFWQHQADGLAVFRAPDVMRVYRLPLSFPEVAVVANRFHLKPLLPLISEDGQFYILALSQNRIRLFFATRHSAEEVVLEGVPASMDDVFTNDDPERQLQFHTGAPVAGSRRAAMFHGHGAGTDDTKSDLLRFFRLVDAGLRPRLKDARAPLLLAGVEYLHSLYREANTYAHLLAHGLTGNPDDLDAHQLHTETLPLVDSFFRQRRETAAERFHALTGTGRASTDLVKILTAAHGGRVDTLFVAVGRQQWGTMDTETGVIRLHAKPRPKNEDLLNAAALQTLLHGGTVYAVEPDQVPAADGEAAIAAILRY